jgi:16S rRNA (cytidine1402-2'-O)-methyltransferase
MVLVIAGAPPATIEPADLVAQVNELVAGGMPLKPAVAQVAGESDFSKSELYQMVLDTRKGK